MEKRNYCRWAKDSYKKIKQGLTYHLIDTTAICILANPFWTVIEKIPAEMTDELSIKARIIGSVVAYAGIGTAISKGRDLSRKLLKITKKTNEIKQFAHDTGYLLAFNTVIPPLVYYASGSRDLKEMSIATGYGLLFALFGGGAMGWTIDVFRDLTGLEGCERKTYPNFVKSQKSLVKKAIATGLVVSMFGCMGLLYHFTPENIKEQKNNQGIEKILEEN